MSDVSNQNLVELLRLLAIGDSRVAPSASCIVLEAANRIVELESQLIESVRRSIDLLEHAQKIQELHRGSIASKAIVNGLEANCTQRGL